MAITTEKYVRKPLYVDAVRITPENFEEICVWCQGTVEQENLENPATTYKVNARRFIRVRVHNPKNPRQSQAFVGDWLLYTERGYKVYTNKAFHSAFDRLLQDIDTTVSVQDKTVLNPTLPKFYMDPDSSELTEKKPGKHAVPLQLDELVNIIRNELIDEEVGSTETTPLSGSTVLAEEIEFIPATPQAIADAVHDKQVLTIEDQKNLTPEEVRDLVQSGEAVLAQDITLP